MTTRLSLLVLLFGAASIAAQTPASVPIEINKVRTTVHADGSLFHHNSNGGFVPLQTGVAEKNLLRSAGIWLIGKDPAGNLKGAVASPSHQDFKAGLPTSAEWNRIWEVSCDAVVAHLQDFQDNGQIDQAQTAIYAFPGLGNTHFEAYNGFGLPFNYQALGGFTDYDNDATYTPENGDYPSIEIRGCPLGQIPDYQNWFVFNDEGAHPSGLVSGQQFEVQTQVFAYKTAAHSLLNNAIFVRYKLINRGAEKLDSCYFGVFADFEIGHPGDDFSGVIPDRNILYAYNGDAQDEGGFETEIPVVALDLMRGPLDAEGEEVPLRHAMIVENADNLSPIEYYRLLTGHFPDGTAAPNGGLMFPDNPNIPNGQSEAALGNVPGPRAGIASFGPFSLMPGAVNELILAWYFVHDAGNTPLQNVQALFEQPDVLQTAFDKCFVGMDPSCTAFTSASPTVENSGITLYPNPATRRVVLESKEAPVASVQMLDLLGRTVRFQHATLNATSIEIDLEGVPAGTYFIRVGNAIFPLIKE
ncbi:MAG: T9SS type A sorting domain-containing protein [Saprospiraceae bacterium]|nr:T9SS type A sorting domain-containing protein [Saprospiraceae bacterium]